jgi:hypothetical protein
VLRARARAPPITFDVSLPVVAVAGSWSGIGTRLRRGLHQRPRHLRHSRLSPRSIVRNAVLHVARHGHGS